MVEVISRHSRILPSIPQRRLDNLDQSFLSLGESFLDTCTLPCSWHSIRDELYSNLELVENRMLLGAIEYMFTFLSKERWRVFRAVLMDRFRTAV